MKIQKYLSQIGFCSRRKAEKYIIENRIWINNNFAKIGDMFDSKKDILFFDKKKIKIIKEKYYILLNKPRGYLSTTYDPKGRKTVLDLVCKIKERVYPVGRLDYRTEGLLILTNDGDLAYRLTHPKYMIKKTYKIRCKGILTLNELDLLKKGIIIDNKYKSKFHDLKVIEYTKESTLLEGTLFEGKNREIRKMLEKINHPVLRLVRNKIGSIVLKDLKIGEYRFLNKIEIKFLKKI